MAASPYDFAVAYRVYPRVSRTPPVFRDNKFKLAELCARSFKNSLGSLRPKIWLLLDACPPEYERMFRSLFPAEDMVILNLTGEGNLPTFVRQIQILSEQTDSELIYFAEDDYYYLPGQFPRLVDFLRANLDADFVTPYDH
ncbi:MAG TPA: glycosyltransferase family 2 protein, partial [Verrucomicrobiae bacterium]|nr:glycosyltransferase family 2 protein [Verrucomicrobiae bacterium]